MSGAAGRPKGRVLVTGGAGYVGAALVPRLLDDGWGVTVLDLFFFAPDVFAPLAGREGLRLVKADIRDGERLRRELPGHDAVVHLACVSNDPSFALDPALSRSINFDAFEPLVRISRESGVRRFVYASTSSVYGVSEAPEVDEDHPLVPLTDYNRFKGMCEPILFEHQGPGFTCVTVRPATVCGYSPRQRLDLTVNILTTHAVAKRQVTVFGGEQQRPNIHIADMVELYARLLEAPADRIAGKTWNAGYQNQSVADIARRVRDVVQEEMPERGAIAVATVPSDDRRSYHISSARIRREFGFSPRRTIEDAVRDLVAAFREGRLPGALDDARYYNVKAMQERAFG